MSDLAADLEARRARHFSRALSLQYDRPLHVVRGEGAYLVDADGRRYLDCINNVAQVGHCHPAVVSAASAQMAVLNTNSRFLLDRPVEYVERLVAELPPPLSVVFLVNSGSEANDLALRLARARTGRPGVAVLDHAYHGHTTALIDISPHKFDGPGGTGRPPHVQVAPAPDPYRGPHRGDRAGPAYAEAVGDACQRGERSGHPVGAFVAESLPASAGQLLPPPGFLPAAYDAARRAGAVVVADEVQTGFGRVGPEFWGFSALGAVPDVVTLGKPMGNGHPIGAVVTSPEVAASFENGMEYFNTYGGNPVACAAGFAVLDVLRAERLPERARATGAYLAGALRDLADRHPAVGDVRGLGLFLGVDLVEDREPRTPAPRLARSVVNRLRDDGVLLSTEGPGANVLKIKPPLVFAREDADRLASALDAALPRAPVR